MVGDRLPAFKYCDLRLNIPHLSDYFSAADIISGSLIQKEQRFRTSEFFSPNRVNFQSYVALVIILPNFVS